MIKKHIIEVQKSFNLPLDKIWEAFTSKEIFPKWFLGANLDTSWEIGTPIKFSGEYQGFSYQDKGMVLQFAPNKLIEYSYLSQFGGYDDKPENYLWVQCSFEERDGGSSVFIRQSNYSEERMEHSKTGWKDLLNGLEKLLI